MPSISETRMSTFPEANNYLLALYEGENNSVLSFYRVIR